MSHVSTIADLLECSFDVAKKIHDRMYGYVIPDWSESSKEELHADCMLVAELEGIEVVPCAS